MSSQMFVDLMVQSLMGEAKKEGEANPFQFPFIGTLAGGIVMIDAIPEPVPLSNFLFLVDDKTTSKPVYEDGDRLLVIPINDGGHWVIVGRLI